MTTQIATEMNEPAYAGLWPRFLALVVDLLLMCAIFFPVTRIVKGVWLMSAWDHLWGYGWLITDPLCLVFLLIILVYFVVFEGIFGATVGKMLLGLQIVGTDGQKTGILPALIRNVLRLVDGLPAFNIVGIVLIVKSPEGARFGDRIAKTRVIAGRVYYRKKILEFINNDHIQASFCSGICIIILALVFKKILHQKITILEDAVPGYIFTIYEAVKSKATRRIISRPLLWNIAMLVGTALVILRHLL